MSEIKKQIAEDGKGKWFTLVVAGLVGLVWFVNSSQKRCAEKGGRHTMKFMGFENTTEFPQPVNP